MDDDSKQGSPKNIVATLRRIGGGSVVIFFIIMALAIFCRCFSIFTGRVFAISNKGGKIIMSKGHGVSSYTHTQEQLDDYANQNNPNHDAYYESRNEDNDD